MHAYDYAAFGRLIVPTALRLKADSVQHSCIRLRRKKRGVRTYGDCAVREVMRHIVGTIKRIPQQLRRYAQP